MSSLITRFDIEKLDENIVQNHGGSKQVGLKQLGSKQCGVNNLSKNKELQGIENVHLGINVGADITVTEVPGQEGLEGNIVGKKKKRSKEAKLENLLKYKSLVNKAIPGSRFQH
ncbi:hypothetical protein Tco_0758122 [Tanacetum coccineum]